MDLILLIFSFFLAWSAGWFILRNFWDQLNFITLIEKLIFSWGTGWGLVTLGMFYESLLHLRPSGVGVLGFVVIVKVILLLIPIKPAEAMSDNKVNEGDTVSGRMNWFEILVIFSCCCCLAYVFWGILIGVNDSQDRWSIWEYKARIFFFEQGVPFAKFPVLAKTWGNWDYPLHLPLMEAWVLNWLGYWNPQLPRLIICFFYLGIGLITYFILRFFVKRENALVGMFAAISFPALMVPTKAALAESILIYYILGSFLLLIKWRKDVQSAQWVLSAIFAGLAGWTKHEGWIFAIYAAGLFWVFSFRGSAFRSKLDLKVLCYIGLILLIAGPWLAVKAFLGLNSIVTDFFIGNQGLLTKLCVLPDMIYKCGMQFGNHWAFNFIWYLFAIVLIFYRRSIWDSWWKYLVGIIIFQMVGLILLGLKLSHDANYFSEGIFRLMILPTILAVWIIVICIGNNKDRNVVE